MRKLLIADDEVGVRTLVRMTLDSERVEIVEAADGRRALEMARAEHPTLVLLDVTMPGMSGFDVCRAIKSDPATAHIHVVMLTAQAQESDRAQGDAAGCDGYFTKPFSPTALLQKVDQVFTEADTA